MSRNYVFLTAIVIASLFATAGGAQETPALKPLQLTETTDTNAAHPASQGDTKKESLQSEAKPPFEKPQPKLGFAIAAAADFGFGLHEQADVRNSFDAGGAIGLDAQMRFIQLKRLRFGFNLGVMHFAHAPKKGTPNIQVASKMNRLTSLASIEFFVNAFFVNGQLGAGFMILSVESELIQNGVSTVSSNSGFNPGPMAGLEIGIELGQHFFNWHREFRIDVHSDWMRHHQRDEVVILMQFSVQLFSTWK